MGVFGESVTLGIVGITQTSASDGGVGVYGGSVGGKGVGVMGEASAGGVAGRFTGNVDVQGDLTVSGDVFLTNRGGGDIAEAFPVVEVAEPGTVMALDENGVLVPSDRCYDRKVVGVVAGAAALRPAITLRHRSQMK